MNKDKFSCPKCGTKVPKIKSVYMTNFTIIRCENCDSRIRPDRKSLSFIGGIGGGLGGLIGSYAIISGNWLLSGLVCLALITVLLVVCSYFTLKFTSFIEVPGA